jgi:hypothetical protein
MTLLLAVVFVGLCLGAFGFWVAHLFDVISDYHEHWQAAREGEDAQATRGTGSCL